MTERTDQGSLATKSFRNGLEFDFDLVRFA